MSNVIADFLDYYYDLLNYVSTRQRRMATFQAHNPPPPATPDAQYQANLTHYLGRERANLRNRRTRLRHGDFSILTQVGQGGYGQVFLAQKKDTREVCALKVMSKKLLFKLDEVRHVLTERDILTNAKSEWLVRLLYAFQDDASIYLAMVCPSTNTIPFGVLLIPLPGIRPRWRFPHSPQQHRCPPQPPRSFLHFRNVPLCRRSSSARIYPS